MALTGEGYIMTTPPPPLDPEITAITVIYAALEPLDDQGRNRVLDYVTAKLGLRLGPRTLPPEVEPHTPGDDRLPEEHEGSTDNDSDGISPVALKWMKRTGLTTDVLSNWFSLGLDEIDLVAKSVPGDTKKERMRSVLLLKGIAAYLAFGAARVPHDQVKEACLHYGAYDGSNFATYLKSFASDVGGTKESGYTLTAKGITAATELLRQ